MCILHEIWVCSFILPFYNLQFYSELLVSIYNYKTLGNVKNNYWQYEKVDDLAEKLNNIAIFFSLDLFLGTTTGLVLWHSCKLNIYKAHCGNILQYGTLIFLYMAGTLNFVISYYLFKCGPGKHHDIM